MRDFSGAALFILPVCLMTQWPFEERWKFDGVAVFVSAQAARPSPAATRAACRRGCLASWLAAREAAELDFHAGGEKRVD